MTLGDAKVGTTVVVTKLKETAHTNVVSWTWELQKEVSCTSEKLLRLEIL